MRSHTRSVTLHCSCKRAFDLLITPSDVRGWWGASRVIIVAQAGGAWAATWGENEDDPDYITAARIETFEPTSRLTLGDYRYRAKSGPLPFHADFRTTFDIHPLQEGCTLQVTQFGFPDGQVADDFLHSCEVGWERTLDALRDYAKNLDR